MDKIGARIKEIRKMENLTQLDFANKLGISRGHVSNLEIGKDKPSDSLIKLICLNWGINEYWLLFGEGSIKDELQVNQLFNGIKDKRILSLLTVLHNMHEDNKNEALSCIEYLTRIFRYIYSDEGYHIDIFRPHEILSILANIYGKITVIEMLLEKFDYELLKSEKNDLTRYTKMMNYRLDNLINYYIHGKYYPENKGSEVEDT